ncbi:MAG: DsrE family protein [Bacteroidetes bacterium]|nr:DsrE family protein [Bacteroidota bacterium]
MNKNYFAFLFSLFFISISTFAQNEIANTNAKHHVILEMTSNDTLAWKGAMNNIKHIKEKWGTDVQVEIVAHGPGIEMLMKQKATQQMQMAALQKEGVQFAACMNSMKARNLSRNDLVQEAEPVPSGVVEVITKQEEGWSYLKSGF